MGYPQKVWTSLSSDNVSFIKGKTSTELFHPLGKLLPVRSVKSQITGQ